MSEQSIKLSAVPEQFRDEMRGQPGVIDDMARANSHHAREFSQAAMSEYDRLKAQSEAMKAKQGLRWIVIADEGQPPEDGYYLATVGSVGIDLSDTTCHELHWLKGKWFFVSGGVEYVEMGPVIAWRYKPKPYQPADHSLEVLDAVQ